jgi:hypothetical protein
MRRAAEQRTTDIGKGCSWTDRGDIAEFRCRFRCSCSAAGIAIAFKCFLVGNICNHRIPQNDAELDLSAITVICIEIIILCP